MDPNATTPWKFRTQVEIINELTQQRQCVFMPNPYQNVSVQVWANPEKKKAKLVVDGRPLSEAVQAEIIRAIRSPTKDAILEWHEQNTNPVGDVAEGLEAGHKSFSRKFEIKVTKNTTKLSQKTEKGAFKNLAKASDNYRNNGPAIVQPNADSLSRPGSKGYRAISKPSTVFGVHSIKKGAQEIKAFDGAMFKGFNKGLSRINKVADGTELAGYVIDGQYDKAKVKTVGIAGSAVGTRAGAAAGLRVGMMLPIPHPFAKVAAIAILSLAGGVTGAIYGEDGAKWLYSLSFQKAPNTFKAFPTDLNNDQFKTYIDSTKLFDPNQEIFGYTKKADGTLEPLRRSDLGE